MPSPALEEESHAVPQAGAGHSEWAGASPALWQQTVSARHIQKTKEAWSLSNSGVSRGPFQSELFLDIKLLGYIEILFYLIGNYI